MKFTKIGAYKLRNGQKQMVEAILSYGTLVGPISPGLVITWWPDGSIQPSGQSGYDIISEWVDPGPIPWTREEVPHGALFRRKSCPNGAWYMMSFTRNGNVALSGYGFVTYVGLATDFEHSKDNGATWRPCHK